MQTRLLLLAALIVSTVTGCVEQPPPDVQFGKLLSASPALQEGESTGVGAVAGVVLGAAGGGAVGRGGGQVVGVLAGGVVGGAAGSAAENASQETRGMAYTIRLDSGQVLTVIQHINTKEAVLQAGARVQLVMAGRKQRVEAAKTP